MLYVFLKIIMRRVQYSLNLEATNNDFEFLQTKRFLNPIELFSQYDIFFL